MWRRPIGPGWSSFAVRGDLLYTQEQRGDDEIVSCYRVSTGEPVWRHRDAVRFWESNGGAGPRGDADAAATAASTPLGATGILNALDARTGAVVWSRNVATDTGTKVPELGLLRARRWWSTTSSSSPRPARSPPTTPPPASRAGSARQRGGGYSSPHLATIDGVDAGPAAERAGAISVAPADGKLLWEHAWAAGGAIVQPALTADGDVLIDAIAMTGGVGTRRLAVARGPADGPSKSAGRRTA